MTFAFKDATLARDDASPDSLAGLVIGISFHGLGVMVREPETEP